MNTPLIPDIDAFDKRAAIAQYEGGLTRNRLRTWQQRRKAFEIQNTTGSGWRSMSWVGLWVKSEP